MESLSFFSFEILYYIAVGVVAGIMSGLFGIGGGLIVIPSLFLILPHFGFDPSVTIRVAMATSLAAMAFSTTTSAYHHFKRQNTLPPVTRAMVFPAIVGSILGVAVARLVSSGLLQLIFALIMILVGVKYTSQKRLNDDADIPARHGQWTLSIGAGVIGFLGAFLGLGGGLFVVPFLLHLKFPTRKAIGTASILTCVVTVVGAIAYLVLSKSKGPDTVGSIYVPAWLAIGGCAALTTRWGAHLVHKIEVTWLRRLFGIVLTAAGIFMLL